MASIPRTSHTGVSQSHSHLTKDDTKYMPVYSTRYWSTLLRTANTQHQREHVQKTQQVLQQKGAQFNASHSHYKMCPWLCSIVRLFEWPTLCCVVLGAIAIANSYGALSNSSHGLPTRHERRHHHPQPRHTYQLTFN